MIIIEYFQKFLDKFKLQTTFSVVWPSIDYPVPRDAKYDMYILFV